MFLTKEEEYHNLAKHLSEIYKEVKAVMLLAEDEDLDQQVILTCINELRNAFDHTMKAFYKGETFASNFKKAVGHLYRAGYDAYEVIAIFLIKSIQDVRQNFSYEAIISAYPEYYSKILPLIEKIKADKVKARSNKTVNDNFTAEQHFKDYEKLVTELSQAKEELNNHLIGIRDAARSIKRKKIKGYIIGGLITIIAAIISAYIISKFFCGFPTGH